MNTFNLSFGQAHRYFASLADFYDLYLQQEALIIIEADTNETLPANLTKPANAQVTDDTNLKYQSYSEGVQI